MNKLVLSLMVVFALVLGACAPQATPAPQITQPPAPVATEEPAPMPEPTEAPQTIVDIAASNEDFSTLGAAVQAAGLVDTLKSEGPFTVFAPTDEAFAKLPAGTLDKLLANPEELKNILLYHVVPGKVMAADVLTMDGKNADTAFESKQIAISIDGDKVMLNDSANVVATDVAASNGVIHVIDSVILPPAEEAMAEEPMAEKAGENLAAAELLLQQGFTDIAASRAYYAMFYIAEALLFTKGLAYSSHSAVISAYGKEFARTGKLNPEHHKHLRDAFQTRQLGDYVVDQEVSSSKAAELIGWGENFLQEAELYLAKSW